MRSPRLSRLALATSLLTAGACKPSVEPKAPAATPASAAGVIVSDSDVVAVDHPAQMLPRDTQMIGWVSGVERVAEVFERDRLFAAYPDAYAELKRDSVREFGVDLFDPQTYPAVGVDPKGRIGLALLSARHDAFAVVLTLADVGKFKQAVRNAAGTKNVELTERQVGPSVVLSEVSGQAGGGIVIRDRIALIVMQRVREEMPVDYTQLIAALDPRQSLAASVQYRKALGGLRDSDAMGFANPQLLLDDVMSESTSDSSNWAEEQLAEGVSSGAAPEEIARLKEQVEKEKEWAEERARSNQAERDIVAMIFDGVEGMGGAMAIKRTGPVVDGQIVLSEGAFARRLLRPLAKGLTLPKELNGQPLLFWGGQVDTDVAMELADLFAQVEGINLHDASQEAQDKLLGFNPLEELKPLLGGEVAVAVTLEAEPDYTHLDELPKQIGVTIQASVTDTAAVERLLAKSAASKTIAGLALTKKDGAYEFKVPEFRTMRAMVTTGNLLITTDPGLAARVATGTDGSIKKDTHPAGPYHVLALPNVSGAFLTDLRYIAGMFMVSFSSMSHAMADMKTEGTEEVPWHVIEESRMSRTSKKLQAKRDAAMDAVRSERTKLDGARTKTMMDRISALGSMAMVVQPNARGLSLAGGHFIGADTLGGVVESMIQLSKDDLDVGVDRSALDAAEKEHRDADAAYRQARKKDYARANKGGRRKARTKK